MQSRRNFIGHVATGLAGTLAAGNALGANQRIRLGIIGPGARGTEILQQALACENVDCIGAADVYTRRLEDVKKIAPAAKTYLDYRRLLDDKDIDAVLIATPQHLHCEHFTAAIASGKHVYQEKTMAFTVDHAKLVDCRGNLLGAAYPLRSLHCRYRPFHRENVRDGNPCRSSAESHDEGALDCASREASRQYYRSSL